MYIHVYTFAKYNFITIFYKYEDTDFPEVNQCNRQMRTRLVMEIP